MSLEALIAVAAIAITIAGMSATAIYQAGVLRGRFDRHESTTEKRLDSLEDSHNNRVTREELDARFAGLKQQLDTILAMLSKLVSGG